MLTQVGDEAGADVRPLHLAELEGEGVGDVLLFDRGLADEELSRLAVVIGEALGSEARLLGGDRLGEAPEASRRILARAAFRLRPAVRLVVRPPRRIAHRHVPVLLEVSHRALGRVDRNVGEVGRTQPFHLRVEVGEVAPLQQRIVAEVDARRDILSAEGDLLGLGEEVVDRPVEHQATDDPHRQHFLGDDLGGVEHVEVEGVGEILVEQLHAQLPFREGAAVDRLPEVATMEVGIGAVDLHRLVPGDRLQAELRLPVELDEGRAILGVEQPESVDAETLHETERARDRPVRHDPHDHVQALGRQRDEVPEIVVGGLRLGKAAIRLRLGGVDQVGELDRVLDEEHRDVVAD